MAESTILQLFCEVPRNIVFSNFLQHFCCFRVRKTRIFGQLFELQSQKASKLPGNFLNFLFFDWHSSVFVKVRVLEGEIRHAFS